MLEALHVVVAREHEYVAGIERGDDAAQRLRYVGSAGRVDADADIDWPQLLAAIKDAPDGEFVKVTDAEANVLVSKRDGVLHVNVVENEEQNATVKVSLPMSVIDGLSIDDNNQIDVAALLTAFDQLPSGDLVTVQSDEANVRVWVE